MYLFDCVHFTTRQIHVALNTCPQTLHQVLLLLLLQEPRGNDSSDFKRHRSTVAYWNDMT